MPTPIRRGSANSGRSPDADLIYQEFLCYHHAINEKIRALDSLPLSQRNEQNVQSARTQLIDLQKQLHPKYIENYNNSAATLNSFQENCAEIEGEVMRVYNQVITPDPLSIHDAIQKQLNFMQERVSNLKSYLSQNHNEIAQLEIEQLKSVEILVKLQAEVEALESSDPKKAKALTDFKKANQALNQLKQVLALIQKNHLILQNDFNHFTSPTGLFEGFQKLTTLKDPGQAALEEINHGNESLKELLNQYTLIEKLMTSFRDHLFSLNHAIKETQTNFLPTPEKPEISKGVELATWYIDWTSWDFPVPEGVNTVNIFVGNMHTDNGGNPVIDGFDNFSDVKMRKFVQECHEKGIAVKISLGGGGGRYDHCWSVLTTSNVFGFAKALVDFCTSFGLDGVDFDIEEFKSKEDRKEQQKLCGQFIKEFKALNPQLSSSLCTNAGFGPYFPWPGVVENIFEGASTIDPISGKKASAIDRLYIMSYYDPIENEKKWILGWYDWLKMHYSYEAHQVTVGIDDKDAHAYDIREMAAFAAEHGFSTGYWEFDPARAADSNNSTHAIEDAYNAHAHVIPFIRG